TITAATTTVATTNATTTNADTTTVTTPDTRCCGRPNRATRIVGGMETEVNEYPWQAFVLVRANGASSGCGGTVINDRYVLSAGHCFSRSTSPAQIEVRLRRHRIDVPEDDLPVTISELTIHPNFRTVRAGFDFALLKLSTPLNFPTLNNLVAPACLPSGGDFANVDAVVSGWGATSENGPVASALREVTVRTQTNAVCLRAYRSITSTMICAGVDGGGKDSCQGDSGGPLVTPVGGRYTLIGVVSWGTGCARPDFPGVYARVTSVLNWIETNTEDANLC
ncbi:trypsin-1-like, partial [Pollicipes pollicipes]|uniref:trypsin-1-like n=1 Tax=Pollicipes pollicipes TaxID=41117 RepID=UPI001884CDF5